MNYNLNFTDMIIRYALMMVTGIIGGLLGSLPIMAFSVFFFLSGILSWCPVFFLLGIDNHKGGMDIDPNARRKAQTVANTTMKEIVPNQPESKQAA